MRVNDCFKQGLLRKTKPSKELAERSLEIAKNTLSKAKENLKLEFFDITLVISYTAMFHAARAVLFRDGIKERSHVCIGLYIQETYPKLRDLANTLNIYRMSRHETLYDLDNDVDEEDAKESVKTAENFIENIEKFLQDSI